MSQAGVELLKPPPVHSHLATLPATHQQRTAALIDIRPGQREGLRDPQARAPQQAQVIQSRLLLVERPPPGRSEREEPIITRARARGRLRLGLAAGEQRGVVDVDRGSVAGHCPRPLPDHQRLEAIRQAGQQLFGKEHRSALARGLVG